MPDSTARQFRQAAGKALSQPQTVSTDDLGPVADEEFLKTVFRSLDRTRAGGDTAGKADPNDLNAVLQEMPHVKPPAIFQKDPVVVASPATATAIYKMISRVAPQFMDKVKHVSHGAPTQSSMEMLTANDLPMEWHGGTNLRGLTNEGRDRIYITEDAPAPLRTLMHEMMHVAGLDDPVVSDVLMPKAYLPKKKP